MTVDEALTQATECGYASECGEACIVLAAEVRRLQRDLDLFRAAGDAAELRIVELREGLLALTQPNAAEVTEQHEDQQQRDNPNDRPTSDGTDRD